ncbi:hypothetical protein B9Z55_000165 [Caenorhabditis nigoni]|uniref:Uncharacterized protein n=1 Tax=Caenorhabditis nigoni TaxID=1611254 RepID=A0A2G5VGS2_9PELO|nr:hypothetical protein B9Z55_000165 [Caenorhabditis nigoni]
MATTPRRFRDSNGNILTVSSLTPRSGLTGGFSNAQQKSISDELGAFVFFDKFEPYRAARVLVLRSKQVDVWPETEAFVRSISRVVNDVTRPPLVFDYTAEEVAYANQLMNMLTRYQFIEKEPHTKVIQLPAVSNSILTKVARQFSVENIIWRNMSNIFKVDQEHIGTFEPNKLDLKCTSRQFMTHLLLKMTTPPEFIQRFTVRQTRRYAESSLENLPEDVTNEIIRLTMEAFGLFRWELDDRMDDEQLRSSSWFLDLGKTDEDRRFVRQRIRDFRCTAKKTFRDMLQLALTEIRRCEVVEGQLVRVNHEKKKTGCTKRRAANVEEDPSLSAENLSFDENEYGQVNEKHQEDNKKYVKKLKSSRARNVPSSSHSMS